MSAQNYSRCDAQNCVPAQNVHTCQISYVLTLHIESTSITPYNHVINERSPINFLHCFVCFDIYISPISAFLHRNKLMHAK